MSIPEGIIKLHCPECGKKVSEFHSRELTDKPSEKKLICPHCRFRCSYIVDAVGNGEVTLFNIESDNNEHFKLMWTLNNKINLAEGMECIFDGDEIGRRKKDVPKDSFDFGCSSCGLSYNIRRWD